MNKNENEKLKIIIEKIDHFENKFKSDIEDESLLSDFQEIFSIIKEEDFSQNLQNEELQQVHTRLAILQDMFANKKEQLKMHSANLLKTQGNIGRYITNSKI